MEQDIDRFTTLLNEVTCPGNDGGRLENEERLLYALTASEEGIWDWNLASDTGYLSPRYYEMLGYEKGTFSGTGKIWATMLHPDDRTRALKNIVDVIRQRKTAYHSSYRLMARDGTYRWILSRAIVVRWNEKGNPLRLVGTHLDNTRAREKDEALKRNRENLEQEVKHRTQELRAANKQMETILNTSSESIWVCDGSGRVMTINRAEEKLLGLKKEQVVGRNVGDLVKERLFDRSATLEALRTFKTVTIMQNLPRIKKQLMVTATPVFDDQGRIEMVITNGRDLTLLNKMRDDLERAQSTSRLYREELTSLNLQELKEQETIAESKEMQQVVVTAMKLARRKVTPVLILGESGTGKGLFAKLIHSRSHDEKSPFVQLNCAALPESLLEAELFGYDKGAFTGARDQGKMGLFEVAKGGTLFLDELGEMSFSVQAKLLKCIEDQEIMRLGGLKPIPIDCTVIAATNQNLVRRIQQDTFRQDLFFRLNTFTLTLPPLRKRPEDILEMTLFFLKKYNMAYGVRRRISTRGIEQIQNHSFPGNVRELQNILKKAVVMGESDVLEDLVQGTGPVSSMRLTEGRESMGTQILPGMDPESETGGNFKTRLQAYEKTLIEKALKKYRTTRSLARYLEVSQSSVVRKLRIYGLTDHLDRTSSNR